MKITAEQSIYHIELTGSFAMKGLGFSCMQKAMEEGIKGQLKYISGEQIQILIQGEENSIDKIRAWFNKQPEIKSTTFRKIHSSNKQFNDFIIINSI